jgi:hypothetical protein
VITLCQNLKVFLKCGKTFPIILFFPQKLAKFFFKQSGTLPLNIPFYFFEVEFLEIIPGKKKKKKLHNKEYLVHS